MTTPGNIHHSLYWGPHDMPDPGDAGTIRVWKDMQICEMVSGASGETRTLAAPDRPGIRFTLRLKTHGGGNVVVTAAEGLNPDLETEATFNTASDILSLVSVSTSTGYRWEIAEGNVGSVATA